MRRHRWPDAYLGVRKSASDHGREVFALQPDTEERLKKEIQRHRRI